MTLSANLEWFHRGSLRGSARELFVSEFRGRCTQQPGRPGSIDGPGEPGGQGGPQCPAFARTKWTTPPVVGHYCLQVAFGWVDDSNPDNNLGQENTQVGTSHSPVTFQFQLRNQKRSEQRFRFETDCYTIPPVPPCRERPSNIRTGRGAVTQRPFDPVTVPSRHQCANYPLPAGWAISFSPAAPQLTAGQEITVVATVDPPPGFTGRQPINVHAFAESGLVGGMTFYVEGS